MSIRKRVGYWLAGVAGRCVAPASGGRVSTATCPECHELVVRGLHPATGHVVLQEPWTTQGRRLAQGGEELWVTQAEGPARPVRVEVAARGDVVGVLTHECYRPREGRVVRRDTPAVREEP